jgi:hypothetical protein
MQFAQLQKSVEALQTAACAAHFGDQCCETGQPPQLLGCITMHNVVISVHIPMMLHAAQQTYVGGSETSNLK